MGGRGASGAARAVVTVVGVVVAAAAVLSSPAKAGGLGREAAALVAIRSALHDPGQVLRDWDPKSGDPCRWNMVTCYGGHVQELSITQQNLSGTLSPAIGRLRSLRFLSLHQNYISGPIPETIGRMKLLRALDLSNNQFSGSIPSTLGNLVDLQYLKLNNNSLSGPVPDSLATSRMIITLDISFNNLSGPQPTFLAWNVFLDGNPLLSDINCEGSEPAGVGTPLHGGRSCSESLALHVVGPEDMKKDDSQIIDKKITVLAIWISIASILLAALVAGAVVLIWHWRGHQRVFAVADDEDPSFTYAAYIQHYLLTMLAESNLVPQDPISAMHPPCIYAGDVANAMGFGLCRPKMMNRIVALHSPPMRKDATEKNGTLLHSAGCVVKPGREISFGHLKHYKFKEMRSATNNFNRRNILGEGGYGIVYKGDLPNGTPVAVKRLKDHDSVVGDDQFHTEVEVISLAVHRNLLHLIGFCIENSEKLLVYPYMPNGTVASKLKECVNGEPALDWQRRRRISLGASRGLLYLHEHCDPKIIHRDIKASNVLLDEYLEAIVADFGLAKLVDHGMSHVVTTVRGTVGRIPPEYFMSGHASEKTDVFCFGLLLIELVTGRETLELHQNEYQKGGILEWAKDLLEQSQLSSFVDKKLRNNYDSAELEKMVQIALLCTMYSPKHRPRMSEVVAMLEEGDGVGEKWEAMKNVDEPDPDESAYRAINYQEDQSNSTELQAVELSGPR